MQASFRDMATRADNAVIQFVENIMESGGIGKADAKLVAGLYFKERLAKIDYGIGHVQVKHGAFYDADVIRRALAMAKAG